MIAGDHIAGYMVMGDLATLLAPGKLGYGAVEVPKQSLCC